ncbi:NADPH:quinone reductase [Virgisporangium aliadipatigenens]|uniref:NADPH:quinone reductase n=1 Tax=Virgisporangium aliadipatigenens TaxID=741659 RepID=A0A8J3YYB7_9ACTN|nr:NADP-dependent oxidoreductase [Virgisporangium aliadipatigenens]GIJ51936.1 NADPH:quinone reductase [Virgisporangium aliadipatigenens]
MRAVVVTAYGPPETFTVGEVPVPRPGPGQLLIRVAAAAINPADLLLPAGGGTPLAFPHVPGNDFAGTVVEVGTGVDSYAPGDEVFGVAIPRVLRAMGGSRPSVGTGSLAEYLVCEAETPMVAHRPAGVSPADAAALATSGMTACAVAAVAAVRPGETALVVGATGGTGTAIVPLLRHAGARVVATSTPADRAALRRLGADGTVGYDDYPDGVDVAVNAVLPGDRLERLAAAVRPGGRLLTITYPPPVSQSIGDGVALRFVLDFDGVHGGMRAVAELAAKGVLPATIGRRYTLDEAPRACVDFARAHTFGKLVVEVL